MANETVTITGTTATARSEEGATATMEVAPLVRELARPRPTTRGLVMPDRIRYFESDGPLTIFVWEVPPQVHNLKWISKKSKVPYSRGPAKAKYDQRRLALPYLVVFAAFVERDGVFTLTGHNEAYFRTAPLRSPEDDELCFPALFNVSRFADPVADGQALAWICSQYLNFDELMLIDDVNERFRKSLGAVYQTLLGTGFNKSSEHHELTSYYTLSAESIPEVADVEAWEKRSVADPDFVLGVNWLPATWKGSPLTVQRLLERTFSLSRQSRPPATSAGDVARVIFNHGTKGKKGTTA